MSDQENSLEQIKENWTKIVRPYAVADHAKSWWQFSSSVIGFISTWYLAFLSLEVSYFLTIALGLLTAGFSVRLFIIMHDCGHGNFFKSKKMRTIIGHICGIFTITPYAQWTKSHGIHHSTSGNLDKRGIGDMLTHTTQEYEKLNWFDRLYYHCYRNPIFTFFLGPIYIFVVEYRTASKIDGPKEKNSVHLTNLALFCIILALSFAIGFKNFLLVQLPITMLACGIGSWLFYMQHQYEDPYWEREENWDFFDAAILGSSFYKLPKLLQYFSGNIGYHHIHHLSHMIPNYNLEKCMRENSLFQTPKTITFKDSIKCAFLNIYDEFEKELISFGQYRKRKLMQQGKSPDFSNTKKNQKLYSANENFISHIGK